PVSLSAGTITVSGSTGGASLLEPSPGQNCDGAPGPEKVFQVTPTVSGYLTAYLPSQTTTMDTVLYARANCDASAPQRLCNDNFGTPGDTGGEVISFHVEAGVPVLVVVDGFEANEGGDFQLSLDLSDGDTCADPVPLVIEGDAPIVATGNTVGETSDGFADSSCSLSGYGPDIIYAVTMVADANYDFDINANSYNSVIHARTSCENAETQIDCDAPPNTNNSSIGINLDGGSTTFIYADGSSNNAGAYSLTVSH
ncbi:MAG: hypothetical protein JNK04_20840, partial [Myxococcales bacterium]|nr:hypothetical protein [Myxococcales bacterium]